MNLYAYAGNNPIAYDDPFGLVCCTGDKNLDDPTRKQIIENTYNTAPATADPQNKGLKNEQGVWASQDPNGSILVSQFSGNPGQTFYPADNNNKIIQPANALFSAHSHPNEGLNYYDPQNGKPLGRFSTTGPGVADKTIAKEQTVPMYVVGANKIWRVDPNGTVTAFDKKLVDKP